jgi:serine protease Do
MKRYDARRGFFLPLAVLAALLAFVIGVAYLDPGDAWTQTGGSASTAGVGVSGDEPVAQVASRLGPSAVQINVSGMRETPYGAQESEGVGSGVIYREDGYIITNHHVVEGAAKVDVSFADGTTERGEVVGTDRTTEIAVIKVDRDGLPAASFAEGREPVVGQMAVAVGSPSGFESTVTSGVVSGVGREVPSEYTGGRQESALVDLIQTDAAISPGNSGGALASQDGEVIGINVAYLPPSETGAVNIGFAIPSETATSVADQLIESGEATHPYLGLLLSDLTPEATRSFGGQADFGALVERVERGGPAADAGIERGDVVTAAGSEKVRNSGDLLSALRDYRPGKIVELTVVRDGLEIQEDVRLGELPR